MRSLASSHTALTSKISVNCEVLVSAETTVVIEPIAMTVATEPAITNNGILTDAFDIITVTVENQLLLQCPHHKHIFDMEMSIVCTPEELVSFYQ